MKIGYFRVEIQDGRQKIQDGGTKKKHQKFHTAMISKLYAKHKLPSAKNTDFDSFHIRIKHLVLSQGAETSSVPYSISQSPKI